uniref:Uncharacterized protein n=1 Tax=Taeniopygia guttata TaxID=59729 RepID=A0A674GRP9_TAEGU
MKAALQGRQDCVAALLLAGADLQAVDAIKGKTAKEWATFTGRFETTARIRSLLRRPRAEQFTARYRPEWPALAQLVAKALSPKSRSKRLLEKIRSFFTFSIPRDPEEDGVLDHMVRMTTALASPFVATACQTVCPDSPPEVGKRRLSLPPELRHSQLHPRAQECGAGLLPPAARAEFDSRRAAGSVTMLRAKVTQVIINSPPRVEPLPAPPRFWGDRSPHSPSEAASLPFVGLGRRQGRIPVGKELQPPRLFPSIPGSLGLPRGCPASPAPCGSARS